MSAGLEAEYSVLDNTDHFNIIEELALEGSSLTKMVSFMKELWTKRKEDNTTEMKKEEEA